MNANRRGRIVALLLFAATHYALAEADLQQASLDSLGVRVSAPIYAQVPVTKDGRTNVTVALTVWLRRMGAADGSFEFPHQKQDAIRVMVWVDDPADLHIRKYGHLWLPVEHSAWVPALTLETASPGPVLTPVLETSAERLSKVPEPPLRPYSFRVDLPPGGADCFRIVESSYPKHKTSVCLPPAAVDGVCAALAPPDQFTDTAPALWMTIGPVRPFQTNRDWDAHHSQVAVRLMHYLTYHVGMGASGLLLYADELMRHYLRGYPATAAALREGTLRLVHWEMPERGHEDSDGRGRTLGYNYDQALFASHAMLGLSACGANLMLLITDLDEHLYSPQPGVRWPAPYGSCIATSSGGDDEPIAMHTLSRIEVLSTKVSPNDEAGMWASSGAAAARAPAAARAVAGNSSAGRSMLAAAQGAAHPLSQYDLIFRKPMKSNHNKPIVLPAAEIVAFFVHEGAPVRFPTTRPVDKDCLVLLHVPNYFRNRTVTGHYVKLNQSDFRHFVHWLFGEDGRVRGSGSQLLGGGFFDLDISGGMAWLGADQRALLVLILLAGLATIVCAGLVMVVVRMRGQAGAARRGRR